MRILNIALLTAFFVFSPVVSQASVNEIEVKVNKIFEPWSKPGIPGAAVAIVQDGRPLLVKELSLQDRIHRPSSVSPEEAMVK